MELITKSFASQCLAFPSRVEQMLASIETVDQAKDMLDKAVAMKSYADQLKAGVEIERPIAFGVLKIKAKIGELLPAKPPKETGRGKTTVPDTVVFNTHTIAAYRKLAKHVDKLTEYYETIDDVPTQTDFIKSIEELEPKHKRNAPPASESAIEGTTSNFSSLVGSKFGTVYADPPWKYGNQGTRASTDNHYDTMSIESLCDMPVREIVADDAHLHLWTTNAFLFEAKRVMDAWGFDYRSVFVWVKPQMGIGNYWRVSHEFLLLGIRGNAKRFNERNHMSWKAFNRGKHSAKPDQLRKTIEGVSPGPFLEMFGRKPVNNWTVFGNQIESGGLFE